MKTIGKEIFHLYETYREVIHYLFFGAVTTLVNIVVYDLCYFRMGLSNVVSVCAAWILAVAVAFVTNKLWVFEKTGGGWQQSLKEFFSFVGFRLLSGGMDLAIMVAAVDWMHGNALFWKIVSNVLVIILNYIFSKFIIFKKTV